MHTLQTEDDIWPGMQALKDLDGFLTPTYIKTCLILNYKFRLANCTRS